jgi:2-phosphosulfolactate phosphatase
VPPLLDVALTQREPLQGEVVVVIDCIRATTTIGRAISAGYERVYCVASVKQARALKGTLDDAVLGGERKGVAPKGFDLGNSPSEYESPRGPTVVLTTTNGTRAILRAAGEAQHVLIGSLAGLDAVSTHAVGLAGAEGIGVRCAGIRGEPALDDVAVAGRFVERFLELDSTRTLTDGAQIALATRRAFPDLEAALRASRSARNLEGTGLEADIADCARENLPSRVPIVAERLSDAAVITAVG